MSLRGPEEWDVGSPWAHAEMQLSNPRHGSSHHPWQLRNPIPPLVTRTEQR